MGTSSYQPTSPYSHKDRSGSSQYYFGSIWGEVVAGIAFHAFDSPGAWASLPSAGTSLAADQCLVFISLDFLVAFDMVNCNSR